MKKAKKILVMVAALALTAAIAVGGTLAYLTAKDAVTNTFTVGNVKITLDEAPVDINGSVIDGDRRDNNSYKLMPGHTYVKDPIVHVDTASENCWLFVKLENGLKPIIDATTIEDQMTAGNAWKLIDEDNSIYAYKDIVGAGANIATFSNFKVKGTETDLAAYKDATIKVTAYAIQADGFATAEAAWTAAGSEAQA